MFLRQSSLKSETVNDLESSKDRRSAGRHGNQHVRLCGAQIISFANTCWVQEQVFGSLLDLQEGTLETELMQSNPSSLLTALVVADPGLDRSAASNTL